MIDLFQTLLIQVEKHDITIGKLSAKNKNVKLNLYYTPTQRSAASRQLRSSERIIFR
jgi:hypothetical protein